MIFGFKKVKKKTKTRGSPSLNTMVIMNPKQFDNFYHRNVYTHAPQKNTLGTSTVQPKNQGAREMWVSLHSIQEIHKTHGKIIGTIYGKISEHVPIKIWDIK